MWIQRASRRKFLEIENKMIRSLNVKALSEAMDRAGLNAAGLAAKLDVSREAVSKWVNGESIPKPDKLLRLGTILGLSFEALVIPSVAEAVPVVSFRQKRTRKTRATHLDHARDTGELLKRLVPYLIEERLTQAPVLKEPRTEYAYVQQVAIAVRKRMGLEPWQPIHFGHLLKEFDGLQAILIPVLWGTQEHHGNALNIYLPDSCTTWVFLNLDSNQQDFLFWAAHELGHSLAPRLSGETGEDFAEAFAQALLFPETQAKTAHAELAALPTVQQRSSTIFRLARQAIISPYTVRQAVKAYEAAANLPNLELEPTSAFMAAVAQMNKAGKTVARALFNSSTQPTPVEYIAAGRKMFNTPFFAALSAFCKAESGAEHFIHQVLGLSLVDSKALAEVLAK